MSGFPILDLVIGMIFVYFLLSIISSAAIEIILTGMKARAGLLEEWLFKIFDKPSGRKDAAGNDISLGQVIMDHCSITGLSEKGKSTSYISAKDFTTALLEKITYDPANPTKVAEGIDDFITALSKTSLLSQEYQRVLLTYANEAKESFNVLEKKTISQIELFRGKIENWFDSSMDRLTDALKKRYSRPVTFLIAVVITVFLNADSVELAKYLYSNPEARAKIAMQAFDATKDSALIKQVEALEIKADSNSQAISPQEIKDHIKEKITDIEKAKQSMSAVMPLTWKAGELKKNGSYSGWLIFAKIIGLLATVLAIMMGAPFWFDILNKISNLRGAGAKPAVSSTEEEKKKN